MGSWRLRVGFEVHARILAKSKLFSGARSAFSQGFFQANEQVAWFDAGLPGALPRLNETCVDQAVRTGIALGGEVQHVSVFERKHYFYGDSPLGFQITQQRWPLVVGGKLAVKYLTNKNNKAKKSKKTETEEKSIRITRIQLEQDTGRSLDGPNGWNLVDLNRAGTGLMEIVTEPDIESELEAVAFCSTIRTLLETAGTCDGNMQDGSLRFDVNISVHSDTVDSHRVEVKNLNSIRSVERAILFEKDRLEQLYTTSPSQRMLSETKTFNVQSGETILLRKKEGVTDYRFFPEPDLPPLVLSQDRINRIRSTMPPLPEEIVSRLMVAPFMLEEEDARVLFGEPGGVEFLSRVVDTMQTESPHVPARNAANWIINVLTGLLRSQGLNLDQGLDPNFIAQLVVLESEGTISTRTGKMVLDFALKQHLRQPGSYARPLDIVETNNWKQVEDLKQLRIIVDQVLVELSKTSKGKSNLKAYFAGKEALFDFFFGQAMRKAQGKANPILLKQALHQALVEKKEKS